jgi:DNA (cytosine-5)-methyltransferase 1
MKPMATTRKFTYASVCDGIGAVHVAWKPLGWECAWVSEIEPFPVAVVDHHFGFTNLGNMLEITEATLEKHGPIDIFVGGTPCQSFSVAGLRRGLDDPRGNLALRFFQLVGAIRPRWVLWENVPGVLSSSRGQDFGLFLGTLGQLGYGFAYRILDAQYFGVPQRRRRVFVVGCFGDWRCAAAVLFERTSLSWISKKVGTFTTHASCVRCLKSSSSNSSHYDETYVCDGGRLRNFTPRERERLQGFPDDYTLIEFRGKPAKDSPRCKALGNSMAVPVMRWIGQRIMAVEAMA